MDITTDLRKRRGDAFKKMGKRVTAHLTVKSGNPNETTAGRLLLGPFLHIVYLLYMEFLYKTPILMAENENKWGNWGCYKQYGWS